LRYIFKKKTVWVTYIEANDLDKVPETDVGEEALSLCVQGKCLGGTLEREDDEITKDPRKLHNDYLQDSPTIIRLIN
jgi:hypothetical protein